MGKLFFWFVVVVAISAPLTKSAGFNCSEDEGRICPERYKNVQYTFSQQALRLDSY